MSGVFGGYDTADCSYAVCILEMEGDTYMDIQEKRVFYCPDDNKVFRAIGYANPVFWADTVADCPICGEKCWEKTVKITFSEYRRLKKAGVQPKRAN